MLEFEMHRPSTLSEALFLFTRFGDDAKALAGGTDLVIALRQKAVGPGPKIIDLSHLSELAFIQEDGDGLRIGPLTTHTQVAESALVRKHAGLLAEAAAAVGSPQIRNRGTIGGNVANAAVCADTVSPLIALEATVKLEQQGGSRVLPLAEFITGPNRTCLESGEILTEIAFSKLPATAGWGFMRLARRAALATARLNVAAILHRDQQGKVITARIAPGAVLPRPGRIQAAESVLLGQRPDQELIEQAAKAVAAEMVAAGRRWSTPYKEPAIIALTQRAIKQALEVEWR